MRILAANYGEGSNLIQKIQSLPLVITVVGAACVIVATVFWGFSFVRMAKQFCGKG